MTSAAARGLRHHTTLADFEICGYTHVVLPSVAQLEARPLSRV